MKEVIANYDFILAEGTALAIQIEHRISVDLDFFTGRSFSTETVYRKLRKAGFDPMVHQEEQETLTVTLDGVKVSFFHYPYPFVEKRIRWKGILLAGILDIASMKAVAISQRGAKRDFIDLYFILRNTPFRKVAENLIQRFGPNRINPVHLGKSLVYFKDAEMDPEPLYCGEEKPDWKTIKRFFSDHVQQMVIDLNRVKGQSTTPPHVL